MIYYGVILIYIHLYLNLYVFQRSDAKKFIDPRYRDPPGKLTLILNKLIVLSSRTLIYSCQTRFLKDCAEAFYRVLV